MDKNKFSEIASKFLKISVEDLRDDMTPADVPQWDSMNYLLMVAELEREYKIALTMDEVTGAKTLGDVKAAIRKRKEI
jgi:acyl carrier protein